MHIRPLTELSREELIEEINRERAQAHDPWRQLMADQAERINVQRLSVWLTRYGVSTPESIEELGARRGQYVNALTRLEPFTRPAIDVDRLAEEIRRVDGNHSLGAGALAEALIPFLTGQCAPKEH
jgi:hypothetical protein